MEQKEYTKNLSRLANLLDALSHPARLQVLEHLAKYKECPAGAISEKLPLSKSTVSQHMTKLKEAGFIDCNPQGICQNYRLNELKLNELKELFSAFLNNILLLSANKKVCKRI
jgi:ArsR family transcriptional regulator